MPFHYWSSTAELLCAEFDRVAEVKGLLVSTLVGTLEPSSLRPSEPNSKIDLGDDGWAFLGRAVASLP